MVLISVMGPAPRPRHARATQAPASPSRRSAQALTCAPPTTRVPAHQPDCKCARPLAGRSMPATGHTAHPWSSFCRDWPVLAAGPTPTHSPGTDASTFVCRVSHPPRLTSARPIEGLHLPAPVGAPTVLQVFTIHDGNVYSICEELSAVLAKSTRRDTRAGDADMAATAAHSVNSADSGCDGREMRTETRARREVELQRRQRTRGLHSTLMTNTMTVAQVGMALTSGRIVAGYGGDIGMLFQVRWWARGHMPSPSHSQRQPWAQPPLRHHKTQPHPPSADAGGGERRRCLHTARDGCGEVLAGTRMKHEASRGKRKKAIPVANGASGH